MPLVPQAIELSAEDRALLDTVRDFARNELLPLDRRWDADDSSLFEAMPMLADMGLLNLLVPHEAGGLGCAYPLFAAILHELSVWSAATSVTLSVHSMVGTIMDRFAPEPLRTQLLACWGRPDHFAAFALSEAGAGSDASAVRTIAVPAPGGYKINGEKMWVTNGLSARWLLTLVRLPGLPDRQNFCTLLVDTTAPGLTRTKIRGKMGIRGSETAVVDYQGVFVPEEHLIGKHGDGMAVCLSSLGRGRVGIAAQATGIAEACLAEMVGYARQREQFDQPIGKFQAVSNMIADSAMELEAAKLLVWRAACGVQSGNVDRRATSMAKLYASEAANRIAYRAVQVHGGTGYVHECRVEQLYRDARITTIYEGTSEIQRIVIGRELAAM